MALGAGHSAGLWSTVNNVKVATNPSRNASPDDDATASPEADDEPPDLDAATRAVLPEEIPILDRRKSKPWSLGQGGVL